MKNFFESRWTSLLLAALFLAAPVQIFFFGYVPPKEIAAVFAMLIALQNFAEFVRKTRWRK